MPSSWSSVVGIVNFEVGATDNPDIKNNGLAVNLWRHLHHQLVELWECVSHQSSHNLAFLKPSKIYLQGVEGFLANGWNSLSDQTEHHKQNWQLYELFLCWYHGSLTKLGKKLKYLERYIFIMCSAWCKLICNIMIYRSWQQWFF